MKSDALIVLAVAGAVMLWSLSRKKAVPVLGGVVPQNGAQSGSPDVTWGTGTQLIRIWEGWHYYSDGTVIGPDGEYYYQGQAVGANFNG